MPKTTDPRVARGRKVLARHRLQIMSRQKAAAGAETKARIKQSEREKTTLNFFRRYDSVAGFVAVVYRFYGDDGSVVRLDSPTLDSPT